MKRIAFISTGGTIAMEADESGYAQPSAGAKELIDSLSDIKKDMIIKDFEYKNIPSAHMTIKNLIFTRPCLKNKYETL